ncbi:MAG: PulJ/GspJ family protein [Thermoguttaceae bacterium]
MKAFTLIELLISMTISLILLLGVAELFRHVGSTINDTQSTLNMAANLNNVAIQLRSDLDNLTVDVSQKPPATTDKGYFEYIEGPSSITPTMEDLTTKDVTVGDVDDILAFTIKAGDAAYPFRGLINGGVQESNYAEVIWFMRGNTLYRRQLIIDEKRNFTPVSVTSANTPTGFYSKNDVSVRAEGGKLVVNSIGELARRENRFLQQMSLATPPSSPSSKFPFPLPGDNYGYTVVPTIDFEDGNFPTTGVYVNTDATTTNLDFWNQPEDKILAAITGTRGNNRVGEDIILTNVISFDVKVWNPEVSVTGVTAPPQFVDLGQKKLIAFNSSGEIPGGWIPTGTGDIGFASEGRYSSPTGGRIGEKVALSATYISDILDGTSIGSGTSPIKNMRNFYDTWTEHYEKTPDNFRSGTNKMNANGHSGVVARTGVGLDPNNTNPDDHDCWECPPPYSLELTGIQITIRCFDPQSGNIRQVVVEKAF